ncbi:MAG: polysaccharide biosynthesis/export family protein [Vicinamibacterales bacterium]
MSAPAQSVDYVVGAQDVLAISVFDQADLGGKYAVDADGTFTFPLLGRVKVGGLTLRGVEDLLRKGLADGFFKNPQISVAVDQFRSQRIFVVGEVRSPGTYSLSGNTSLIEVLARAGSTTEGASGEVLIVRPKAGSAVDGPVMPEQQELADVVRIDIRALQSGRVTQNTQLRDNDTIFVPQADLVYVFGQVRSPGAFALKRGTTVLQALSLAGGVTDRGATNRTRVVRMVDGKRTEIRARLEDQVNPGDTLIVPERFF